MDRRSIHVASVSVGIGAVLGALCYSSTFAGTAFMSVLSSVLAIGAFKLFYRSQPLMVRNLLIESVWHDRWIRYYNWRLFTRTPVFMVDCLLLGLLITHPWWWRFLQGSAWCLLPLVAFWATFVELLVRKRSASRVTVEIYRIDDRKLPSDAEQEREWREFVEWLPEFAYGQSYTFDVASRMRDQFDGQVFENDLKDRRFIFVKETVAESVGASEPVVTLGSEQLPGTQTAEELKKAFNSIVEA